jgi:hypothetical protein
MEMECGKEEMGTEDEVWVRKWDKGGARQYLLGWVIDDSMYLMHWMNASLLSITFFFHFCAYVVFAVRDP